jgi:hypothetical protein
MVMTCSARLQAVAHLVEEGGPVFLAHRFEHLDRRDAVEAPFEIAIVEEARLNSGSQPFALNARLRVVELLLGDRDRRDLAAILARNEAGEPAPAATDLQ